MKKYIAIILLGLIVFLTGCNSGGTKSNLRAYVTSLDIKSQEVSFKVEVRDPDKELDDDNFLVKVTLDKDSKEQETTLSKGQLKTFKFNELERKSTYTITVWGNKDGKLISLLISTNNTFETLSQGDVVEDPLVITTTEEFLAMNAKKHYKLGNDLDFNNESFAPLFTSGTPFSGSFDGDSHTISNVNIVESKDVNKAYLSIFGYSSKSIIKNVTFDNIHINNDANSYTGIHYVGLVVSKVSNNSFEMTGITIKNSSLTIKHNINNITTNRNLYVGLLGGSLQGKIANINIVDSTINVTQHSLNGRYAGTDVATTGTYIGGAVGLIESDKGFGINKISVIDSTLNVDVIQDKPGKGSGDLYVGGIFGANRSDRLTSELVSNTNININHENHDDTESDKLDNVYVGGISGVLKSSSENLYYYGEINISIDTKINDVNAALITAQASKSSTNVLASGSIEINTLDEEDKTNAKFWVYHNLTLISWSTYKDQVKLYNNPTMKLDDVLFDLSDYQTVVSIDELITSEYILDLFN